MEFRISHLSSISPSGDNFQHATTYTFRRTLVLHLVIFYETLKGVNGEKCSIRVNKEKGNWDERKAPNCCGRRGDDISCYNVFTHNEKRMMSGPSHRWGSFSVRRNDKHGRHGTRGFRTPNSDVRRRGWEKQKRLENFNLMKARYKIKIKDLMKSLNAPTYISHHKKERRKGSSCDPFLKNYYTYFSPLVLA